MVFNDIIDIYRASFVEDGFGKHRDWSSPKRIVSAPAIVLPVARAAFIDRSESRDPDRELSEVSIHIYLRPVDVRHTDRVQVNSGDMYEVFGNPITWKGRTASYMRITAKRVI